MAKKITKSQKRAMEKAPKNKDNIVEVKCDYCDCEFKLNRDNLHVKDHLLQNGIEVEINYFNCIECNREYVAYVHDATIKSDLRELEHVTKKLRRISKASPGTERQENLLADFYRRKELIANKSKALKGVYAREQEGVLES